MRYLKNAYRVFLKFFFTMVMMNQDDNLSIDEDIDESQVLHPSLVRTATPVAINDSRKTKARVASQASAATGTGTQRGRAWREKDSILLIQAFE